MEKESSKILRFLYNTAPGRLVLKFITAPFVSKIGGAYMDSAISKIHIKSFIKNNDIDMSEYVKEEYSCFNDCFTRNIIEEKRPMEKGDDILISPCDGLLSAYHISDKSEFYIKKNYYTVADLLGCEKDDELAKGFENGTCLIFRLCVNNYHRYGYVDDGTIISNKEIPGKLHTVRPIAIRRYPIFIQNAREATVIETKNFGKIAQVEVGALMIGKIKNHKKSGNVKKGTEKGMFLYGGSTIVMLVKENAIELPEDLFIKSEEGLEVDVKFRQTIGKKRGDIYAN